jgi:uncharacterized membrane protein
MRCLLVWAAWPNIHCHMHRVAVMLLAVALLLCIEFRLNGVAKINTLLWQPGFACTLCSTTQLRLALGAMVMKARR